MEIRIEPHTLKRAAERGADKAEIISCIKNGRILPAKNGRFAKEMIFIFNSMWNNKFNEQKKLEVIYTIGYCYRYNYSLCFLWKMGVDK